MQSKIFIALTLLLFALPTFAADTAPNVVLVLADDFGYGDSNFLNPASTIATPHLDRLATQGMAFTDAHTPCAVCTPTRYGLITGRYCWRSRLKRGVLNGYSEPLIDTNRRTIADVFAAGGYHTGIIGKWHLGLGFQPKDQPANKQDFDYTKPLTNTPNDYGFNFSYVIPASLDFPPYVYIRNTKVTSNPTIQQPAVSFPGYLRAGPRGTDFIMEEALDHLTGQAVSYIKRQAATPEPFFLYFPLTAPHKPALPHRRFVGKTGLGPYGDFIRQVDYTVGQITLALRQNNIDENTLVIFTSDNGSYMRRYDEADAVGHATDHTEQGFRADEHTSNKHWRGTKADIWEAGHRVPFFARWPKAIKANTVNPTTICLTDLFATAAEITGARLDDISGEDSFSILPLLMGNDWATPRAPIISQSGGPMFAIRQGDWKLVLGTGSGGRQLPKGKAFEKPYNLFNLTSDPSETTNVIDQHPDIAKQLEAQFESIHEGMSSR